MELLAVDWHPYWSYEWWRDIGVGMVSGLGAIAVGGAALGVSIYAARLTRASHRAQVEAERARLEPMLRARWIALDDGRSGPISQWFPVAKLLIENVGAGNAYQLSVKLGEGEVWGFPEDARPGFKEVYAQNIAIPGKTLSIRWVGYLGRARTEELPIPPLDDTLDFVLEFPRGN